MSDMIDSCCQQGPSFLVHGFYPQNHHVSVAGQEEESQNREKHPTE